ncbi:hypothetical protein RN001_004812 [Aquatica leii]|uniref:limulus clotting factor C n=1 Tax=Aquatica leii TaxID=1421715 RepID=A0AAN7QJU3_9COLE|nr:hypothetical protein RN001_004812 [Aquatica leii]
MLYRKIKILHFVFIFLYVEGNTAENECGIQYNINRIIDGTITDLREFPWMALLIYQTAKGPGLACGGVLVNQKFVLTAAHCVTGNSAKKIGNLIAVRLGEYDTRTNPDCDENPIDEDCAASHVDIYVDSIYFHPNYTAKSSSRYNDIALVKLQTAVTYSKDLQPICLPSVSSEGLWINPGSELHISGWGQTETRESGSFVKLKAKVPVVNRQKCNTPYSAKGIVIGDLQLCAGGGTTDTCKGDSGGPLMFEDNSNLTDPRWYAVGVTSFGAEPCATKDVPAIYTKITPYLEWINSIITL